MPTPRLRNSVKAANAIFIVVATAFNLFIALNAHRMATSCRPTQKFVDCSLNVD